MTETPWREAAALIREARDPDTHEVVRTVVMEAPLRTIVEEISGMGRAARVPFKIMLPDRRVRPYQFDGLDFDRLVEELRVLRYRARA